MINLDLIFPTPIWWIDLSIDVREMQRVCYEIASTTAGRSKTNRGGINYQSSDFHAEKIISDGNKADEFSNVLRHIKKLANEAFDSYKSFATDLTFANAWVNINNHGGYNEVHTHPGAIISGVLYIKIPTTGDPGNICFHRNAMEAYTIHSLGVAEDISTADVAHTRAKVTYEPTEGRLILFPAWIPHGVRENNTNEDRISVSFNFIPNRGKRDMRAIIMAHGEAHGQSDPPLPAKPESQ